MKKLVLTMLALLFIVAAEAKTVKTSFNVNGKCEMCETRIEKTAKGVAGVVAANWNQKTKMLTLIYDDKKTSPLKVQQALVKVGHDAGKLKASDKTYNSLPTCCKYRN